MKSTEKIFASPLQKDVTRVVNYDKEGNEFITWEEFDYKTFQQSLGFVSDWSLNNLLSAGIDPSFPIHTGINTRLDGIDTMNEFMTALDAVIAEQNNKQE